MAGVDDDDEESDAAGAGGIVYGGNMDGTRCDMDEPAPPRVPDNNPASSCAAAAAEARKVLGIGISPVWRALFVDDGSAIRAC
jgi:hypothetical protein